MWTTQLLQAGDRQVAWRPCHQGNARSAGKSRWNNLTCTFMLLWLIPKIGAVGAFC